MKVLRGHALPERLQQEADDAVLAERLQQEADDAALARRLWKEEIDLVRAILAQELLEDEEELVAGGGGLPPKDRKLPKTGGNGSGGDPKVKIVNYEVEEKKELPATGEESNALASALGILLTTVGGMGVAVGALKRRKNS